MFNSNNFICELIISLFIKKSMLRMLDIDIFKIEQLRNYSTHVHVYSCIVKNELLDNWTINGRGNKRQKKI